MPRICAFIQIFLFCFCLISANAQSLEEKLSIVKENYQLEKISIHTDKPYYLPGDTIWLKAYIMADDLPSDLSTKISIRLVDDSNHVIKNIALPIRNSIAAGNFVLDSSFTSGVYSMVAVTNYMVGQSPENFYYKRVEILDKPGENEKKNLINYKAEFFPEAGNIIAGIANTVAFKFTDQYGSPVKAAAVLLDRSGNEVSTFYSNENGLGKMRFEPEQDQVYTVKLDVGNGFQNNFPFPAIQANGIGIEAAILNKEILIEINSSRVINQKLKPKFVVITQNNELVSRLDFENKEHSTIRIKNELFKDGIIQFTLFNEESKPLIERLFFINNGNHQLELTIEKKVTDFQKKAKNEIELTFKGDAASSMSVSVTDASYDITVSQTDNIITDLLFTGELKGKVNNPAQYFKDADLATAQALDLVMMTNGWRRYNWNETKDTGFQKPIRLPNSYLTYSGIITERYSGKPVSAAGIDILLKDKEGILGMTKILTNDSGQFSINDLIAFDAVTIDVIAVTSSKGKALKMHQLKFSITSNPLSDELVNTISLNPPLSRLQHTNIDISTFQEKLNPLFKTLETVVIAPLKRWQVLAKSNDSYTQGTRFWIGESRSVNLLVDTLTTNPQESVYDFIPKGFGVISKGIEDGRPYLLYKGPGAMSIFIDNEKKETSLLKTMKIREVALIKMFGEKSPGVLAIFTRNEKDFRKIAVNYSESSTVIEGFSPTKEFYSPDYATNPQAAQKPDLRTTIYWNPYLENLAKGNTIPIQFYNSDNCKKFKVLLQGFDANGKFISIEKLIE